MIDMGKRVYKAPAIQEIEIGACNVVCTSLPVVDEETNTGGRAGCNERGSWGNIWENR